MLKPILWFYLLLLPFASQAQLPSDFKLEKIFGTPLYSPLDLAVDRQSNLHVLDDGFVTTLDSQGVFVRRVSITNPAKPGLQGDALSMDAAGNYYVADFSGEVRKFNPAGQMLLTFGETGFLPGQLYKPISLRVDDAGSIYVIEQSSSRLQKFDAQGNLAWVFDAAPNPTNTILNATALGLDQAGNAYVLESDFAVIKISPTGRFMQRLELANTSPNGSGGEGSSLTLDKDGNLYVGLPRANGIRKYAESGQLLTTLRVPQYGLHTTVALNRAGNVYATSLSQDGVDSRLYKFTPAGQQLGVWGNLTSFDYPVQDGTGSFWVYDIFAQKLVKFDAAGREVVRVAITAAVSNQASVVGLACDMQNNLYAFVAGYSESHIEKFSAQGRSIRIIENTTLATLNADSFNMAVDPAGSIYVINAQNNVVQKLDQQGRQLLQFGSQGQGPGQFDQARGLAVDGRGYVYVADINGHRVQKFSPAGQFLRENKALTGQDTYVARCMVGLSVDKAGTIFLGSSMDDFVQVYDPSGRFSRHLPGNCSRLTINSSGTRLLTLHGQQSSNPSRYRPYADAINCYTATTPALASVRESQITGRIFVDQAATCDALTAPALPNTVVVAEPGNYYGLSDENGNYTIAADTGTYIIRQLLPHESGRLIEQTCASAQSVRVTQYGTSVTGPNFGNLVALTPYLSVNVASNRRRRCFRNVTAVTYANTGFATAPHTKVVVELPAHVLFIAASVPHTRDAKGNYVFEVGTLPPGQRGTITIQDSVACGNPTIRGLMVCTKAWITPLNTYPNPAGWNKASIAVSGTAQPGNQVRFAVTNTGYGATTDSLSLRVYQDSQLALVHHFSLAAADSLVLRVPATGQVVRVEADQPTGHPLKTQASATIELPGRVGGGLPSVAMPAFPPDDVEPEKAVDCQPILDSYDPNDKQVLPVGFTTAHYTPTNTPLRYQVRFQNTGNDVAYRVEVVDTLAADLDLSTLQVGAVSHPYRLTVTGKTRPVLTFTFDTILLPASSQDQVRSNGFLQFSIQPKAGLAPKTSIANYADIYFDFNEPVRTNTTRNSIFDMPLTVDPSQQLTAQDVLMSPSIQRFSPAQGRAGTLVTLTGQHFAPAAGNNHVLFQGVVAPVLSATTTTLTVRVPAGVASTALTLVTPDGSARSAASFTVFQPPVLTTLSAEEGVPGAIIMLTGNHFAPLASQDTVIVNGIISRVVQASATALQVEVPVGATVGIVEVRTLGGQVRSAQPFTIWYPPTVTALSSAKGKVGAEIVLTGTNFASAAVRNVVTFGAVSAAVLQASTTQLRVRISALTQSGAVQVHTPGGTASAPFPFRFIPAPTITSFTPAEGHAGTLVTLTGQDFLIEGAVDTVYFQGLPAVVVSSSSTHLVVEAPKGVTTGLISVVGAGGSGHASSDFRVPALSLAEAIAVYPNPATAGFTINWHQADFAVQHVRLLNGVGSIVFEQDLQSNTTDAIHIQLPMTRAGLYLLVLQTEKGTITKRVTLL
jgi:sugar lactone lactonase YvrE